MNCLVILATFWLAKSIDLTCPLSVCPDINKGDHRCDPGCMTSYCNYDTTLEINGSPQKESSDCYNNCVNLDSCDPQNLGNGICDSSCNTENCGFDWGDCTCSPGCLNSMLGDGNCDEACDNWDCDLDNHDCGQCADGCFPNMLGNGICDLECNNEDCLYDYKDCQCAENCLYTDYGACKPECLVASCEFDKVTQYPNSWCYNTSLAIFSSYQQIIRNDFSYVTRLDDCYAASNYACSWEKLVDFSNCYDECNILECNYANGNCNSQDYLCQRYHPDGCLKCRDLYWAISILWNKNCILAEEIWFNATKFPDESSVIVPLIDTSSSKNPHIYFIISAGDPSSKAGNGNYFSPYVGFSYGLSRIKYNYSIIYLLEGDHFYTLEKHSIGKSMTGEGYYTNVMDLFQNFYGKSIKITPLKNSSITIRRSKDNNEAKTFSFYIKDAKIFEINNIVFDWQDTISSCVGSEYCDYCPFAVYDSALGYFYNDRGEIFENFLPLSWCIKYSMKNFIQVISSSLVLRNVTFINFRTGFLTILCTMNGSNITLSNVTFDNIKVYDGDNAAVIVSELCTDDFLEPNTGNSYGNLKFENGAVRRINNGYEINDAINLKGFLKITSISTIVFRNIEFQNNVVFRKSMLGTNEASLFFLNIFQALLIDSCAFEYNYCDLGIINIQQERGEFSLEINDKGEVIYSTLSNIHIKNSNFTSNYGITAGILYANFKDEAQNFLIEDSQFILNGIEAGPLIHIESSLSNQKYLKDSIVNITKSNGIAVERKYLAKWGKILKSKFNENYSGGNGIFEIAKMININISTVEISNNGATLSTNINSLLVKYYIENPDLYIKSNAKDSPELNCQLLSSISDSINFNIQSANIKKNYCKSYLPGILMSNTEKISIKSSYFENNSGAGSNGICLIFKGNDLVTIKDSKFNSNINYETGNSGAISSLSSLLLQNCSFYNNTGDVGGALYFEGQNLYIDSSTFDSNKSPNLNGGAIYFLISPSNNKTLQISDTKFTNNYGGLNGGGIFIHKNSPLKYILSFTISDTYFYNNQALEGSCIYIDDTTLISADSSIANCDFKENKARFSGAISTHYISGQLTFTQCTFFNNAGAYSSGFNIEIGENSEIKSKIIFKSCAFQFNSGIVTVSLDNPNINSTLEMDNCSFEYNRGSIFSLDNDNLIEKNSRYLHNYSPISGAVLNLKNSAVFRSEKATFHNCSSEINGGVASISQKSQFFCFSCIFTQNSAGSSGGVIYADSDAQFHIYGSNLSKNICKNRGSAIFTASSLVSSSIVNTEISENYSYNEGAIALLSSLISITASKFSNNSASGKNPGIFLEDSDATILNSVFSDQNGDQGCFILLSMSYLKSVNSSFKNGFSNSSGVAIHATSSTVNLISTSFSNLFSADSGGIIYLYEASTLYSENSNFTNSNTSIDTSSSSLFIANSFFKNYSNSAISGAQMVSLSILNSDFSDGYGVNGGALYCLQCSDISINSAYFFNNFAENGGAIYIENSENSQCNIENSTFVSNIAGNGGAIWATGINLYIFASNFYENHAEAWQTETLQEIIDGIGGAMKLECENSDCFFDFSSNDFRSNWADYNGGAINWDDSKPNFTNNSFWNNSAEYGNDIASFPVMMIFINNTNNNRVLNDDWESSMTLTLNDIASGQKDNPPLTFALVDDLHQIITTDITSQAQLKSLSSDTIISGTSTAYAVNGIYYFDDYAISAKPGTLAQIYIDSSAIDESKSVNMPSQFLINAKMRLCKVGEATVGLECESCLKNYYNIDARNSKCFDCPSSAICYGNYTMVPKSGFWRDNKFTDRFWKCLYPPACLGSLDIKNISFTGICEEGYENNLCHSCKEGYSRLYKNECQKCPDTISNVFRLIGIFTLLVFIAIVIIITSRKSAFEPASFSSIYIKIFWNYLQIMIIIATFNLNWPREAVELFYFQTCMDYIGAQLFSIDCFLQNSYSKEKIYYYKILITSLTPFSLAFICLLLWIVIYAIKRKNLRELKNDYISSFTILLFLIHPSIIDTMFSIFSCKEINSGEYWLNADLGIRCWDSNHLFYALLFALPTINIWVIAIPALCLIKLIKSKSTLEDISTRLRFGFLFNGYSSKYYYWEFLILYYKVILIMCSVFFSNISINIQALTVALLLAIFLHIQTKNQPYRENLLNKADKLSRVASLIAILSGLFFLTGDLDIIGKNILLIILLLSNLLFIIYILIQFLMQFYIFNAAIGVFKRIFALNKGRKYVVDVDHENPNKLEKDYAPIASQNIKIISTAIFSEDSNIGHLAEFERSANISIEIDPVPSEQSV